MAVEASAEDFNKWLNKKLESFEIEDEVMASYISSIVTTDEQEDDKKDMLSDIFQDLVQGVNVDALCQEILEKWTLTCSNSESDNQVEKEKLDLSSRVSLIVEKSVQPVQKSTNRSAEEQKLREAILSRCTYVSSEEDDYGGGSDCEGAGASSMTSPPQNQNTESVAQAEKEKREKMKQEAEKKKAQDKVNREKQKHKQEERREKERKRTQKQERRR